MASSKKTREEEKARNKTKLTNPENKNKKKKKKKPTSEKPKNRTTISDGAVKKPEVVVPASSSSADSQRQEPESQQDSEQEHDNRTEETANQRSKTKKPKKTTHNRDEVEENDEDDEKACRFPTKRIWRIAKSQSSGSSITGDAVFLVNKATEKFLEQFCEDGFAQCVKDRKKSLSYKHLVNSDGIFKSPMIESCTCLSNPATFIPLGSSSHLRDRERASVVCKQRRYDFLSDFVPEKIKAEAALAESKLTEKGAG